MGLSFNVDGCFVAAKKTLPVQGFPGERADFRQLWRDNHGNFLLLFAGLILIIGGLVMAIPNPPPQRDVTTTDGAPQDTKMVGVEAVDPTVTQAIGDAAVLDLPEVGKTLVTVTISGAKSDKGMMRVAAFAGAADFEDMDSAIAKNSLPIQAGRAIWKLLLPEGTTIGIEAYHDRNENGELDKVFGIPNEPYGFSRGARGQMGPPSFESTAIKVTGQTMEVTFEVW